MALTLKAFAIWLVILGSAVANGALREAFLIPWIGKTAGLIASGLLLSVLIVAITFAVFPWLGANRISQLLAVGFGWLALTLVFEFSFGRLQGKSWPTILEAYTFKDGNIWPVVLLVTLAAPYIASRLRGWA